MSYGETKVYFDGSHYIAIPHSTRPTKKRPVKREELVEVIEEKEGSIAVNEVEPSISIEEDDFDNCENEQKDDDKSPERNVRMMTRKEIFEELYIKYIDLSKRERRSKIIAEMMPYFSSIEHCKGYVKQNLERKQRNLICRRIRMCRKAYLANFNYFCTFTYDDKKHTEKTFKKALQTCFRNLCYRKEWKYMGVWERAPQSNRLHFHGLFSIPENSLPGEIIKVRDYDINSHKMRETYQCTYFNERFGRSDFEEVNDYENRIGNAITYLIKYIEKTGEKIVYSKGLPQFFISDILEDDVVSTIGQEDRKLLLFDNFRCWDEGVFMGNVCPEVIKQMRKSN